MVGHQLGVRSPNGWESYATGDVPPRPLCQLCMNSEMVLTCVFYGEFNSMVNLLSYCMSILLSKDHPKLQVCRHTKIQTQVQYVDELRHGALREWSGDDLTQKAPRPPQQRGGLGGAKGDLVRH